MKRLVFFCLGFCLLVMAVNAVEVAHFHNQDVVIDKGNNLNVITANETGMVVTNNFSFGGFGLSGYGVSLTGGEGVMGEAYTPLLGLGRTFIKKDYTSGIGVVGKGRAGGLFKVSEDISKFSSQYSGIFTGGKGIFIYGDNASLNVAKSNFKVGQNGNVISPNFPAITSSNDFCNDVTLPVVTDPNSYTDIKTLTVNIPAAGKMNVMLEGNISWYWADYRLYLGGYDVVNLILYDQDNPTVRYSIPSTTKCSFHTSKIFSVDGKGTKNYVFAVSLMNYLTAKDTSPRSVPAGTTGRYWVSGTMYGIYTSH